MFEVPKPPNQTDPSHLLQSTSRSRTAASSILRRNACREPFLKQPNVLGTDAAAAAYKARAHLRPPPGLSRKVFGGNHVYKLPVGIMNSPEWGYAPTGPGQCSITPRRARGVSSVSVCIIDTRWAPRGSSCSSASVSVWSPSQSKTVPPSVLLQLKPTQTGSPTVTAASGA